MNTIPTAGDLTVAVAPVPIHRIGVVALFATASVSGSVTTGGTAAYTNSGTIALIAKGADVAVIT